jgi:hypothetical protein
MSGTISPRAQAKLAALSTLGDRVSRAHGLVEQYAAAQANPDQYLMPLGRVLGQLKMEFMGAGLDAMSQLAGSMAIAAKRGFAASAKARILREGVGSLKFQIELAQRAVVADDLAEQRKEAESEDPA